MIPVQQTHHLNKRGDKHLQSGGVSMVSLTASGRALVTGSKAGSAWLWDARAGVPSGVLRGGGDGLSCMCLNPDQVGAWLGQWGGGTRRGGWGWESGMRGREAWCSGALHASSRRHGPGLWQASPAAFLAPNCLAPYLSSPHAHATCLPMLPQFSELWLAFAPRPLPTLLLRFLISLLHHPLVLPCPP